MMDCVWSRFEPGTISFCEARLCGWIAEPANTWSNIGYLIVGILIAIEARRRGRSGINFFSVTSTYLFFGSTAFHATGVFWGEVLDVSAMFLLSACLLAINLQRTFNFSRTRTTLNYLGIVLASVMLLLTHKPSGIPVFAVQLILALALEFHLYRQSARQTGGSKLDYTDFKRGLICFAVAFAFWILDFTKVLCDPDNHILTGHSIWHLTNAGTIYFLARFYRPFMAPSAKP